jgi:hydroxyethylthiazole kinase
MEKKIWKHFQNVRAKSPLVHNITNYVVMNSTANALLAVGASPVMAHAVEEVEDMVKIANALVINIGTLSPRWIEAMKLAVKEANRLNKPIVFDPVGAGATAFRNKTIRELLEVGKFSVIRANASELMAIESSENRTKGVDSTNSFEQAYNSAKYLSGKYSNVVCMSGKTDIVISGKLRMKIHNGHEMMSRVTGLGCTATAIIGAFIGIIEDTFEAAVSAMAIMGVAGELAAKISAGPGSLQLNLLDKLFNMTEQEFLQTVKLENNA